MIKLLLDAYSFTVFNVQPGECITMGLITDRVGQALAMIAVLVFCDMFCLKIYISLAAYSNVIVLIPHALCYWIIAM